MSYEKCYYKLFNATSDAISQMQSIMLSLQAVQLQTEQILTEDDSPIPLEEE